MLKRKWLHLAIMLAGLLLVVREGTAGSPAGGIPPLPIIGEIGSFAQAIDVQGDLAYVGFGTDFAVIDISNKEFPVQTGSLSFPEDVKAIQVVENIVYLALPNQFVVVDVTQPYFPVQKDDFSATWINDMKIEGEYAYLLAATSLIIVNISDPDYIFEVGRHIIGPSVYPTNLTIDGDIAFASKHGGYFHGTYVIDISNPETPFEIAYWYLVQGPHTAVRENIFYTVYGTCTMYYCPTVFVSYDISDLQNPEIVYHVENGNDYILDLELEGNYAYTGSRTQLQIYALGSGGYAFLGHYFGANEIEDVAVEGGYVYLAGEDGFQIVQGPPYSPVYLPSLMNP